MLYSGGGGLFPIPWCMPGCPGPIMCRIPGIIIGPIPGWPLCMPCMPAGPGPRIIIPFISMLDPLGIMPSGLPGICCICCIRIRCIICICWCCCICMLDICICCC